MPDFFRRCQRDTDSFKIRSQLLLFLLESKHVSNLHCRLPTEYLAVFGLWPSVFGLWLVALFKVQKPKTQDLFSYPSTAPVSSASPTPSSAPAPLPLGFLLISSTSRQSDCNSRTSTLNDSGRPGSKSASPLTIAS